MRAQVRAETLGVAAEGNGWRFWRRPADSSRWLPVTDDDVLSAHGLPPGMTVSPLSYAGQPLPANAIVPLRASGHNEPYALILVARDTRIVLAADPLNRVAMRRRRSRMRMIRRRGFTLVEILVALAIVAVALAAGMRALAQSADSATALKARTLGLWVAQNRLAAAQIAAPWPGVGHYQGDARRPARDSSGARQSRRRPTPHSARSTSP